MSLHVIRVWLPDRPGALGAVATRVGAVRGDVVGIEIIERGAGRAIDEITVELPDDDLVELLVLEIGEVDGVDVEDVRPLGAPHEDPAVTALGVAARVVTAASEAALADAMVQGAVELLRADWAALVDLETSQLVASAGDGVPNGAWVAGYVRGTTASGAAELEELALAEVPDHRWVLVVARDALPLRGRERAVLDGLGGLG
jgi:hypothetical protein